MSYSLPKHLVGLAPYEPIAGDYPIRLDANESFIPLDGTLQEQINAEIARLPLNRYPDAYASELVRRFSAVQNISENQVVAGNGSDELISLIVQTFTRQNDVVLVLTPDFSMYQFYADLLGRHVIVVPKDEGFLLSDLYQVLKTIKPALVLFSNPCNPTGTLWKREEVLNLIRSTSALVVVDEAYMDFANESILPNVAGIASQSGYEGHQLDNVIVLRTMSKAFALAGARLGFAISSLPIIHVLMSVKSPYNVNAVSQCIGSIILAQPTLVQKAIACIVESRDSLYQKLLAIHLPGSVVFEPHANFVYMATPFAEEMFQCLKARGIIVRKFIGHLRITAGDKPENLAVVDTLMAFQGK